MSVRTKENIWTKTVDLYDGPPSPPHPASSSHPLAPASLYLHIPMTHYKGVHTFYN